MKYNAHYLIRGTNTFVTIPLENYDDSDDTVKDHVENFGNQIGLDLLYVQRVKEAGV